MIPIVPATTMPAVRIFTINVKRPPVLPSQNALSRIAQFSPSAKTGIEMVAEIIALRAAIVRINLWLSLIAPHTIILF